MKKDKMRPSKNVLDRRNCPVKPLKETEEWRKAREAATPVKKRGGNGR